jgi:hypothetical protein
MALRVTQPFGDHAVGDDITGTSAVEAILSSEQAAFVVRVEDAPEPDAETPAPATSQE